MSDVPCRSSSPRAFSSPSARFCAMEPPSENPAYTSPRSEYGAAAATARFSSSSLPISSLNAMPSSTVSNVRPSNRSGRAPRARAPRSRSAASRTAGRRP